MSSFFFSSRRRHTRSVSAFLLNRSSDLPEHGTMFTLNLFSRSRRKTNKRKSKHSAMLRNKETRHRMFIGLLNRSEERRVGKEWRDRWAPYDEKKKNK